MTRKNYDRWENQERTCKICGAPFMAEHPKQLYCSDACRSIAQMQCRKRYMEKQRAKRIAEKRGTDPERFRGKETQCVYKDKCKWASDEFCNWMAHHQRSRLLAGYPIVDGKCGAFEAGKKKKARVELPANAGWSYKDFGEV